MNKSVLLKLCFYVPVDYAEQVKSAVFSAGAGRIGNYDCCSWQTLGQGQFRPLPGSQPFMGQHDQVEQVQELKVEMVCEQKHIEAVILALKASHPYETPAFEVLPILMS